MCRPRSLAVLLGAVLAVLAVVEAPARAEAPAPAALGKVRFEPGRCADSVLPASQCKKATVSCPGVADLEVTIKVTDPAGPAKGTVVLGAGGGGEPWYEQAYGRAGVEHTLLPLRAAGFRLIQKSWQGGPGGWFRGPGGMRALACRYATLAEALHRELAAGPAFCAVGGSGGASEVAHALAHYGLGRLFDGVVYASGPVSSRIDHGCLAEQSPGWASACRKLHANTVGLCAYTGIEPRMIDMTYGPEVRACATRDANFGERWRSDSLLSPGAILDYPGTELRFVFGSSDGSVAAPLGNLYAEAVKSAKKVRVLREAPHTLPGTEPGARAIAEAVEEICKARGAAR